MTPERWISRLIRKSKNKKRRPAFLPFALLSQPQRLHVYPHKGIWHREWWFFADNCMGEMTLFLLVWLLEIITKPHFVPLKRSLFLIYGFQIFSVTNNTECGKLLEEIRCALCSPHSQSLFHSPEREALGRDPVLPLLCKDYCKEFFYTCRGHIPGITKKKKKKN